MIMSALIFIYTTPELLRNVQKAWNKHPCININDLTTKRYLDLYTLLYSLSYKFLKKKKSQLNI